MEKFISTDLGNFFLYTNAQAFEISIGRAYRLGVAAKAENGDGTFRNVNFVCDELDTDNNGINFRNISDLGSKNVDLIVQATSSDLYHLVKVGEANSISEEDFKKEIDFILNNDKQRYAGDSPFITALRGCSLENLYELSQSLNNSDLNEAVNNYRDFEDYYSQFDSNELLNFIKYNDISKYQEDNEILLDIRDESFISEAEAINEIVNDYGEDIYDALKDALANGKAEEISLDDINYDLAEAFDKTLASEERAEQQNLKKSNTKGRKI